MSHRSIAAVAVLVVLIGSSALAQAPASDPQALTYAAQALSALTGGTNISDVTLSGSVIWNGNADTGTATLKALGTAESRVELTLSNGTRTDIRDAQTGVPVGQWINPDSSTGKYALQNCLTDSVWFFPAFSSMSGGTDTVLVYIGLETRNGQQVQHIQSYVYAGSVVGAAQPTPEQLSTMDFYLDATTYLPTATTFNTHPDSDAATNLNVEVDFSDYQSFSGVLVPSHITRHQQGTLLVDLTVTGASFNTGLPLSTFEVK